MTSLVGTVRWFGFVFAIANVLLVARADAEDRAACVSPRLSQMRIVGNTLSAAAARAWSRDLSSPIQERFGLQATVDLSNSFYAPYPGYGSFVILRLDGVDPSEVERSALNQSTNAAIESSSHWLTQITKEEGSLTLIIHALKFRGMETPIFAIETLRGERIVFDLRPDRSGDLTPKATRGAVVDCLKDASGIPDEVDFFDILDSWCTLEDRAKDVAVLIQTCVTGCPTVVGCVPCIVQAVLLLGCDTAAYGDCLGD